MKRIFLFLCLFMYLAQPSSLLAEESQPNLDLKGKSLILIEQDTGKVLYENNSDQPLPPASMTKMMTLLLVAEALEEARVSINDTVIVSEHAASMGGSQIFLEPNEEMSVDDLLKAVAIASANDASVALAEYIYGSEQAFIQAMNDKVAELGLEQTHFQNTTGLPAEDHYSSAYDMAMIARELLKYEFITDYTSIYEDYLRKDTEDEFWLVNTNRLVKFYPGVDGLKTGFTQEAKYCLTATAKKDNMRLIAVVMGAESPKERNATISRLLDFGYAQFQLQQLYTTEQTVTDMEIIKGEVNRIDVYPKQNASILTKKGEDLSLIETKIEINDQIMAPIKKDEVVGSLEIYLNDQLIDSVDLVAGANVERANVWQLMADSFRRLVKVGKS
ncbi:D-alanyl-D-alanine carboxypeptidase family protein [Amphibacillus xylanus]|uniref:serine-type D-Ala-D-Ala carboxypeptidase n=1 Tax=Amphibacillus xylanus (strain ATCC 51415 / DSM 6626 / JCM 7361 / LMG 17667 / NBRC 15112 / Ep01) TaxID=698758 RepID=K0IY32_AMPXN|nr:D-alanyl-D-alanine carboxypeptidase family protein [Amphibacillus xylanus]BAM47334.1 D-alanyl-D-alanine carboxypeptidase DacF [Amphibacillus xylanus NBRC 15112]